MEIDEDVELESAHIPPPDIVDVPESQEMADIHMLVRWIMTLLAIFQTRFYITDRALKWMLKFLVVLFQFLGRFSEKIAVLASFLPRSMIQYNDSLVIESKLFQRRAVCKECNSLYTFDECLTKTGSCTVINRCSFKLFSKTCNQLLMKEVISRSSTHKFYPHKVSCFTSLIASLQALVLRSGFIQMCESTRNSFDSMNFTDVYDGSIWKDFMTVEGRPFLSVCNNYGLLLNIDWLQPYKHIEYSVGVMYLVILNLPRSVRFKRENVILFGIIPGPCEPSRTINTYLAPLVADLLDLWKGVELQVPGTTNTAVFKCALLGVACDLPAARKTCGFLSYTANLGCSRCYQSFSRGFGVRNCYDNFEREQWVLRTNNQHRSDVSKILECTTKTRRDKMESELGCRYSSLLDLPYFCPIEMMLIDPMHNLFLGTAKHFARGIWISRNILDTCALSKIEAKLRNFVVPVGLGRIPVSISIGRFLTADQWKNWTLYFSIFCLRDLLSNDELECWRHFVLACRRLCSFSVTNNDIIVADRLLLNFCKRAARIYGSNAITPNMHMHCHLTQCVKEFGPIHTFWLFPFERYNGVLEGQPTNNRSIELQLMRRFQRDNMHLHLHHEAQQWPNADHFLQAIPDTPYDIASPVTFDHSVLPGPKYVISSLAPHLVECLRELYSDLYPAYEAQIMDTTFNIPSTYKKYCSIKWHGKQISSSFNKSCKNPFVFAAPPFQFTTSNPTEFERKERLVEVDYFLVHSIFLPGRSELKSHLLTCAKWPMVHPKRSHFGKPVEVWCTDTYEPMSRNKFFLASSISSRAIISTAKLSSECVCIAIPVIE